MYSSLRWLNPMTQTPVITHVNVETSSELSFVRIQLVMVHTARCAETKFFDCNWPRQNKIHLPQQIRNAVTASNPQRRVNIANTTVLFGPYAQKSKDCRDSSNERKQGRQKPR